MSRPNTHTSWISTGPNNGKMNESGAAGIYGSITSGIDSGNGGINTPITSMYHGRDSVYQALATDVISIPNPSQGRIKRPENIFNGSETAYYSRNNLNFGGFSNNEKDSTYYLKNFDANRNQRTSEYGEYKEFEQGNNGVFL